MTTYEEINEKTKYIFTLTHKEINDIIWTLENSDVPNIMWFEERLKGAIKQ